MFLVVQFRCFLVTKSFAFTLIPPSFIHSPSPYWGPRWNSCPGMVGISCCSVGTLFATEVVGESSSQHSITGSLIAREVAALKFLKDIFSSTLSVAKIEGNQRNQRYLCGIFPVPHPQLLLPHGPYKGHEGIWRFRFFKTLIDVCDMQLLPQHEKNFVPCLVASL